MKKKEWTLDMLAAVKRPDRYTGGEFGSIVKESADVRVALAFPDVYEVGMSYLGFKILYHLVNKMEGIAAERVYAPWVDMEALMRERDVVLTTLETKRALSELDAVGFTLQYELSYTNILNMLDLGGVPVRKEDRGDTDPLVLVGGPCVFNPEPLADFIDVALLGDGEEALPEVLEALRQWKLAGRPGGRKGFLHRVVQIPGVYVPEFYAAEYNDDGTLRAMRTTDPAAPAYVEKRAVEDLNAVDFRRRPSCLSAKSSTTALCWKCSGAAAAAAGSATPASSTVPCGNGVRTCCAVWPTCRSTTRAMTRFPLCP